MVICAAVGVPGIYFLRTYYNEMNNQIQIWSPSYIYLPTQPF